MLTAGPLALSAIRGADALTYARPLRARSLCGRRWDWVEALGPA
jgi:hypothetical protein